MPTYKLNIEVNGKDRASGPLKRVAGSLGRVAEFAVGGLLVDGIQAAGRAIGGLAQSAVGAVSNIQSLEMSLQGLLTESLMYEEVNKQRQVALSLSEAQKVNLNELIIKEEKQRAQLQSMIEEYGDFSGATAGQVAEYENLQYALGKTTSQITQLSGREGQLATVTETSIQQTRSFEEAQVLAAEKVEELLGFIEELSIKSPFETTQVEQIAQIGLAARLSAEEVQQFTGAFLDYSAVHGITSSNLAFAAEQFLQLKQAGALTTIDLRQLRRMGIDVARIIGVDMSDGVAEAADRFGELSPEAEKVFSGMQLDVTEFNKIAKESPEVIDAIFQKFILMSEQTSAGASEKMAGTIGGMMSTVNDIVELGSRKLFRPIFEAVSPALAEGLDKISGFVTGPGIEDLGERIGENLGRGVGAIKDFAAGDVTGGLLEIQAIIMDVFGPRAARAFGELRPKIVNLATWFREGLPLALQKLKTFWDTNVRPILLSGVEKWQQLQDNLAPIISTFREKLPVAMAKLKAVWDSVLKPALEGLGQFVADVVAPNLGKVAKVVLGMLIPALIGAAVAAAPFIALGAALVALGLLWKKHGKKVKTTVWQIKTLIKATFDFVKEKARGWLATVIEVYANFRENAQGTFDKLLQWLRGTWLGKTVAVFRKLPRSIRRSIDEAKNIITGFKDSVASAFRGIRDAIQSAINKIKDFVERLKDIALPDFLKPGSPTPFELGLRGIADAMKDLNAIHLPRLQASLDIPSPDLQTNLDVGLPDLQTNLDVGLPDLQSTLDNWRLQAALDVQLPSPRIGPTAPRTNTMYDNRTIAGDTFNITVNDKGGARMIMAMVEDRRRRRLSGAMA